MIYRTGILYRNAHDGSTVDWLLANIGDEVLVEHLINVKEYAIASADTPCVTNNKDGYFQDGVITGLDFSKFNVGDVIQCVNYTDNTNYGDRTIVEKYDDTRIRFDAQLGGHTDNQSDVHIVFSIKNAVTALNYKWNFIENNEAVNYTSKVDGSEQLASITGLNAAGGGINKPMTYTGSPCYQLGAITVDELGITTLPVYTSFFQIKHSTKITPLMLEEQWSDVLSGVKPTYFDNLNCLKSCFYYEARYLSSDPNRIQTLEIDEQLGNSGWFNENFNTGITKYSASALAYTFNSVTVPRPKIATGLNQFTFDIDNTTTSPFVAGATKLVLNFAKAPNDKDEYQNNGRDLRHNFVWDSCILTAQNTPTPINGEQYADTYIRSLKNVKATMVSASKVRISGEFDFQPNGIAVFEESEVPRYMFFVAVQNSALTGASSDRVTLKIDFNDFYYQNEFPNLITFTSKLISHKYNNYSLSAIDRVTKFSEDELVGFSNVRVNTDPLVTSFELTKYTAYIKAYNTVTGAEFILESKQLDLPASPVISGYQYFNLAVNKATHVPTTEIRKQIIARSFPPDPFRYELAYPFLVRWEYWVSIFNPTAISTQEWRTYFTGDWILRFTNELTAKVNGSPATYSDSINFEAYRENLDNQQITANIQTFDPVTNVQLISGSNKYILGYANTLVKATFTRHIPWTKYIIVIGIEVFEEGGINGKYRMSSEWASDSDTYFLPVSSMSANKVKLTNVSSIVVTGECLIDFTKLNLGKSKWKLSARIYDDNGVSGGSLTDGYGYLKTQNVSLIATNPINVDTQVVMPKQLNCCSDLVWNVLADTTTTDDLKNDKNSFLFWFNKDVINTAVLKLVKDNGVEYTLTANTNYGTPYDYGFKTNTLSEKLVGYLVDWNKVINTLGEGMYHVKCDANTIFGATITQLSESYCLKQYTPYRAENTVRIEFYNTGIIGSKFDEKQKDFGTLNWYNQHRFDGHFIYKNSEIKEEDILYSNGQRKYVELDQEPEFTLDLKPIPAFKHDVLRLEVVMADSILITDYNSKNFENYYKKKVRIKGSYNPKLYPLKSKLGSVSLSFIQEFNNLKKFRS